MTSLFLSALSPSLSFATEKNRGGDRKKNEGKGRKRKGYNQGVCQKKRGKEGEKTQGQRKGMDGQRRGEVGSDGGEETSRSSSPSHNPTALQLNRLKGGKGGGVSC